MSINYSIKVNERAVPLAITNEAHIIGIIATATYSPGNVRLTEVPQGPTPNVFIAGYIEIPSGAPVGTQFVVDYTTGVITFNTAQDGNSIAVSYTGLGSEIAAEDVNELQNPLSSIATQTIVYNWPSAPTVTWSLAANIVKPANISNTSTDDFIFPHNVNVANMLSVAGMTSSETLTLLDGSAVIFQDTEGSPKSVTLEAPNILINSYLLKWPLQQGAAGTFLQNDGAGNLSFVPASGSFVSSITGTPNQVIASSSTGAVTLSLPQSIANTSNVQFGTLGLGASLVPSAILSLVSTVQGFLPPVMTTTQRDAIVSPAAGLEIYNSSNNEPQVYNGTIWTSMGGGGGGTPGGSNLDIQFNNGGAFGGSDQWIYTSGNAPAVALKGLSGLSPTFTFYGLSSSLIGLSEDGLTNYGNLTFDTDGMGSGISLLTGGSQVQLITFTGNFTLGNTDAFLDVPLAIGGAVDPSAILTLTSTTQGFLPPVMTTTQRNAMVVAATGTATVLNYLLLSGQTLTVNGFVLTEGVDWTAATSNAATATSLASAITTATASTLSTAAAVSAVITITANAVGESGNSITLVSSDPTDLSVSGSTLSGGSPAEGLELYDSTLHQWYGWNGTSWVILG